MFYAAYVFYGTAFMYNHVILCIFSPNLEVEINITIIIIPESYLDNEIGSRWVDAHSQRFHGY